VKKILLGQLGAYGDCIFATAIAKQIKKDFPDCHLTWAIGSMYTSILDNNPHVDSIWQVPITNRLDVTNCWWGFASDAIRKQELGLFDRVYLTQIYPGNPDEFYGSVRTSMFRTYGTPIDSADPVIKLTPWEIKRVKDFAKRHDLMNYNNVILYEYLPQSEKSKLTPADAIKIAADVVLSRRDTCVILTGKDELDPFVKYTVVDGSSLTVREMVYLTNYCTLFIGTGSGITQVIQAEDAKRIPMVLILKRGSVASVVNDCALIGKPRDDIIEMVDPSAHLVEHCIDSILVGNFGLAKQRYHTAVNPDFTVIRFHMRVVNAIRNRNPLSAVRAFGVAISEYGAGVDLMRFFIRIPIDALKMLTGKSAGLR
jgi:hypothetical protein